MPVGNIPAHHHRVENNHHAENSTPTSTHPPQGGLNIGDKYFAEDSNKTMRELRPTTLTVGLGFPDLAKVRLDHNFNKYFSAGASIGTMFIVVNDIEVHARGHFLGNKNISAFAEVGLHNMFMLDSQNGGFKYGPMPNAKLGVDYRSDGGFAAHLSAGAAFDPKGMVNGNANEISPSFEFGLGWAF